MRERWSGSSRVSPFRDTRTAPDSVPPAASEAVVLTPAVEVAAAVTDEEGPVEWAGS